MSDDMNTASPDPMDPCLSDQETSRAKNISSLVASAVFLALSAPGTYKLTNSIALAVSSDLQLCDANGCPNAKGLVVHAILYSAIVRALMNHLPADCRRPQSDKDKWIAAGMGGLLFIMVSSPFTYKITNSVFDSVLSSDIASAKGCPNVGGLAVHTAVFGGITRFMMR
jgi:hypothetical protein